MWGFDTLKDCLDVVIVPVVVFGVGILLPRWLEKCKRDSFVSLRKRELEEMEPQPRQEDTDGTWHQHLKKRFIHGAIFQNPSANRDFILSLPASLAYNEAQLWAHYEMAVKSRIPEDLAEHGASWCDYLKAICRFTDGKKGNSFHSRIYKPWEDLIIAYHPELERTGRLFRMQSEVDPAWPGL